MVFPHRTCGFAAGAAPIPVYGWDFFTEKGSPRHDWEVTRQSNGRVEPGRPCCARSSGRGELHALLGRFLELRRERFDVRNDARIGGQPKIRVVVVRHNAATETHR